MSHALPRLPGVRWVVDSIPIARTNNNSTGFFVTTSSCRPAVSCVGDVDLPFFSEPSGAAKRLEDGFALKIGLLAKLPRCTVVMEACGSAHYWARQACAVGHEARLIGPRYVKALSRGQKNDRNDAEGYRVRSASAANSACSDQDRGATSSACSASHP